MNDLLPCPFCGGDAELWRAHGGRPAWVACLGKCAVLVTQDHTTDEDAIAAWNRRALPAASQPEAEPVAWQQRLASGGWGTILHGNDKPIGEARPLYTTPAPVVPAEGLERAREDEAKAGWVLDMELLKELRSDAGDWGYSLDLEAVEAIALEVEKRLRAQQPAAPVSGVTVQEAGWQPIETAPYDIPVRVKLGKATIIAAVLRKDAAMNTDLTPCDQWQAYFEGEHPECWSDGACWENNADEVMSLQPSAWSALLPDGGV